ncbi:MAG: hypothetical protein H7Y43_18150 [Akkermansiaceae bacterium]|nr:hypothetical protein [Verrucomicrobiales bacterium]
MRFLRLALICLLPLAGAGCAGYRLGPTNGVAAGEKTLQLTPFSNQTMQPRLGDAVTTSLRRNLQRDGTFKLATRGGADVEITGVLTHYHRHELSFVPRDVLTVSDFRINVKARVTARDRISGKTILDKEVSGYTLVRAGSDLTSAERQAVPVLADDLAKNILSLLVDGTW